MLFIFTKHRTTLHFRGLCALIAVSFLLSTILPPAIGHAQTALNLPIPRSIINLSPAYNPAVIKGIRIFPDDPLKFDFILDPGDSGLAGDALRSESEKLIKYFLSSLTIPEENLWVNLSPHEKDRIISDDFSQTIMGQDLLAQDYFLKQLTASLMYPENELGVKFWERVKTEARQRYGVEELPTEMFNKVWIVPQRASIYVEGDMVFVADSHLRVMLEEDYVVARDSDTVTRKQSLGPRATGHARLPARQESPFILQIIKEIILPAIEKEVNTGASFAKLRQIYHAVILATWFKRNLRESLLGEVYFNRNKLTGVADAKISDREKIYNEYLKAFKQGVYDYIKEEYDPSTQQVVARKYFSGGASFNQVPLTSQSLPVSLDAAMVASVKLKAQTDQAILTESDTAVSVLSEEEGAGIEDSLTFEDPDADYKKILLYVVLEELYAQIEEGDTSAINRLSDLIEKWPHFADENVFRSLRSVNRGELYRTYDAKKAFVVHRSDLIDESFIDDLIEEIEESPSSYYSIANIFIEIFRHRPDLIHPEVLDKLIKFQKASYRKFDYESRAKLLLAMARSKGMFAKKVTSQFLDELDDTNPDFQLRALYAMYALGELAGIDPDLVDRNAIFGRLEELKHLFWDTKDLSKYIIFVSKLKPDVIDEDLVLQFKDSLKSDTLSFKSRSGGEYTLKVVDIIARQRSDLIDEDFVGLVSGKYIDSSVTEKGYYPLRSLVELSDQYREIIVSDLWFIEERRGRGILNFSMIAAPVLIGLMEGDPQLAKDLLDKSMERLRETANDPFRMGGQNTIDFLVEVAKVIPSAFDSGIIDQIFASIQESDFRFLPSVFEHQMVLSAIALEISAVNPKLAKDIVRRMIAESRSGAENSLVESRDLPSISIEAMESVVKVSPELLDEEMIQQALGALSPSFLDRSSDDRDMHDNWEVEADLQRSKQFLIYVHQVRPDLIRAEDLFRYKVVREGTRLAAGSASLLLEMVAHDGVDFETVEKYRDRVLSKLEILPGDRDQVNSALLIYVYLLSKGESPNLLFKFAFQDKDKLKTLVTAASNLIISGEDAYVVDLLKRNKHVDQVVSEIEERNMLASLEMDVYSPTRSWNTLERWLEVLKDFSYNKNIIIAHIVITMELLKQGVGEQAGFRSRDSVEDRIPRVRERLIEVLETIPGFISQKRLTRSMSFGTRDEVELLRRQAIDMVREATGLADSRRGVVGRIRDRIHNQQSPQDLPVVRAYRAFVEEDEVELLQKYDYTPEDSDIVAPERKESALAAIDSLIETLEFIYGDENLSSMSDFLDRLDLGDKDSFKERIRSFVDSDGLEGIEALEKIISVRKDLYAVNREASEEQLLSTVRLDNRLEILYYRFFNEYKETLDVSNLSQATRLLRNILQGVSVSGYSSKEIEHILREIEGLNVSEAGLDEKELLRYYAILKRIENIIRFHVRETVDQYQEMANRLGVAANMEDSIWIENFSSNLFRADIIYLLSILLTDIKSIVMKRAEISGWQVIVSGNTEGKLRFLSSVDELSSVQPDEIIVLERLPSDSPPIVNVRAIIVLNEDAVLSHPAIRARQHNIPMVVAPNIDELKTLEGKNVSLKTEGDEQVFIKEKKIKRKSETKSESKKIGRKPIKLIEPDLDEDSPFIINQNDYQIQAVGNKARRLTRISPRLMANQLTTKHFGLRFGFFEHILGLEVNREIRQELDRISERLFSETSSAIQEELLLDIRLAIRDLHIPHQYLEEIYDKIRKEFGEDARIFFRSSTNAEDLDGYAGAGLYDSYGNIKPSPMVIDVYVKNVWASKWNSRAFFDREINGIDHSKAVVGVLIQESIAPNYAFVVYTKNPLNPDEVVIEVVQGYGESLVSGDEEFSGSPYRFIFDRKTETVKLVRFANKRKKLANRADGEMDMFMALYADDPIISKEGLAMIREIAKASLRIESEFDGVAQDIEGGVVINEGHKKPIWQSVFLQTRDQNGQSDAAMGIEDQDDGLRRLRDLMQEDKSFRMLEAAGVGWQLRDSVDFGVEFDPEHHTVYVDKRILEADLDDRAFHHLFSALVLRAYYQLRFGARDQNDNYYSGLDVFSLYKIYNRLWRSKGLLENLIKNDALGQVETVSWILEGVDLERKYYTTTVMVQLMQAQKAIHKRLEGKSAYGLEHREVIFSFLRMDDLFNLTETLAESELSENLGQLLDDLGREVDQFKMVSPSLVFDDLQSVLDEIREALDSGQEQDPRGRLKSTISAANEAIKGYKESGDYQKVFESVGPIFYSLDEKELRQRDWLERLQTWVRASVPHYQDFIDLKQRFLDLQSIPLGEGLILALRMFERFSALIRQDPTFNKEYIGLQWKSHLEDIYLKLFELVGLNGLADEHYLFLFDESDYKDFSEYTNSQKRRVEALRIIKEGGGFIWIGRIYELTDFVLDEEWTTRERYAKVEGPFDLSAVRLFLINHQPFLSGNERFSEEFVEVLKEAKVAPTAAVSAQLLLRVNFLFESGYVTKREAVRLIKGRGQLDEYMFSILKRFDRGEDKRTKIESERYRKIDELKEKKSAGVITEDEQRWLDEEPFEDYFRSSDHSRMKKYLEPMFVSLSFSQKRQIILDIFDVQSDKQKEKLFLSFRRLATDRHSDWEEGVQLLFDIYLNSENESHRNQAFSFLRIFFNHNFVADYIYKYLGESLDNDDIRRKLERLFVQLEVDIGGSEGQIDGLIEFLFYPWEYVQRFGNGVLATSLIKQVGGSSYHARNYAGEEDYTFLRFLLNEESDRPPYFFLQALRGSLPSGRGNVNQYRNDVINLTAGLDNYAGAPGVKGRTFFTSLRNSFHRSPGHPGHLNLIRTILGFWYSLDQDSLKRENENLFKRFVEDTDIPEEEMQSYHTILNDIIARVKERFTHIDYESLDSDVEAFLLLEEDELDGVLDDIKQEDLDKLSVEVGQQREERQKEENFNPEYFDRVAEREQEQLIKNIDKVQMMIKLYYALNLLYGSLHSTMLGEFRDGDFSDEELNFMRDEFMRLVKSEDQNDLLRSIQILVSIRKRMNELMAEDVSVEDFIEKHRKEDGYMFRLLTDFERGNKVNMHQAKIEANKFKGDLFENDLRLTAFSETLFSRWLEQVQTAEAQDRLTDDNFTVLMNYLEFIELAEVGGVEFSELVEQLRAERLSLSQQRDVLIALRGEIRKMVRKINEGMREQSVPILSNITDRTSLKDEFQEMVDGDSEWDVNITEEKAQEISDSLIGKLINSTQILMLDEFLMLMVDAIPEHTVSERVDDFTIPGTVKGWDPYIFRFSQNGSSSDHRRLLSDWSKKGLHLIRLAENDARVPPGFIISAKLTHHLPELETDIFKERIAVELKELKQYTSLVTLKFVVFARSGSAVTLPGLLATIPNLGINREEADQIAQETGDLFFAYDTYGEFLRSFSIHVLGVDEELFKDILDVDKKPDMTSEQMREIVNQYEALIDREVGLDQIPQTLEAQVIKATKAIYQSWDDPHMAKYRAQHGLSQDWGTAVIIQKAVFGNLNETKDGKVSGSGVGTLKTLPNGEEVFQGRFRFRGQGDQLMSRADTNFVFLDPSQIQNGGQALADLQPAIYQDLLSEAKRLKRIFGYPPMLEFTTEMGVTWIAQHNDADFTNGENAPQFEHRAPPVELGRGTGVSGGAFRGIVVHSIDQAKEVLARLQNNPQKDIDGPILFLQRISPQMISQIPQGVAIIAQLMSVHTETLAQTNHIPAIYQVKGLDYDSEQNTWVLNGEELPEGKHISIDGHENASAFKDSGRIFDGFIPLKSSDKQRREQLLDRQLVGATDADLRAEIERGFNGGDQAMEVKGGVESFDSALLSDPGMGLRMELIFDEINNLDNRYTWQAEKALRYFQGREKRPRDVSAQMNLEQEIDELKMQLEEEKNELDAVDVEAIRDELEREKEELKERRRYDPSYRLWEIAKKEVLYGLDARATLKEAFEHVQSYSMILIKRIMALSIVAGYLPEAKEMARKLSSKEKVYSLIQIGIAEVKSGLNARETFNLARENVLNSLFNLFDVESTWFYPLRQIALAQARAGYIEDAYLTVDKIQGWGVSDLKEDAQDKVKEVEASYQASLGNFDRAREIAETINSSFIYIRSLIGIAKAVAQNGVSAHELFEEVKGLVDERNNRVPALPYDERINPKDQGGLLMQELIIAQVEVGYFLEAKETQSHAQHTLSRWSYGPNSIDYIVSLLEAQRKGVLSHDNITNAIESYLSGDIELMPLDIVGLMRVVTTVDISPYQAPIKQREILMKMVKEFLKRSYGDDSEIEDMLRRFYGKFQRDKGRYKELELREDAEGLEKFNESLDSANRSLIDSMRLIVSTNFMTVEENYRPTLLIWVLGRSLHPKEMHDVVELLKFDAAHEGIFSWLIDYLIDAPFTSERKARAEDYQRRWDFLKQYALLFKVMEVFGLTEMEKVKLDYDMKGQLNDEYGLSDVERLFSRTKKGLLEYLLDIDLNEDTKDIQLSDELINIIFYFGQYPTDELKEVIKQYIEFGPEAVWAYIGQLPGNEEYRNRNRFLEGPESVTQFVESVEDVGEYIASQRHMLYEDIMQNLETIKLDYPEDQVLSARITSFQQTLSGRALLDIEPIKDFLEEIKQKGNQRQPGEIARGNKGANDIIDRIKDIENLEGRNFKAKSDRITFYVSQDPVEILHLGVGFASCLDCRTGVMRKDTVSYLLDLNKRIVYAKDSQGRRVGRVTVALAEADGEEVLVPISRFYTNTALDLAEGMLKYLMSYADHIGVPLLITDQMFTGLGGAEDVHIILGKVFSSSFYSDFKFVPGKAVRKSNVWRYTPDDADRDVQLPSDLSVPEPVLSGSDSAVVAESEDDSMQQQSRRQWFDGILGKVKEALESKDTDPQNVPEGFMVIDRRELLQRAAAAAASLHIDASPVLSVLARGASQPVVVAQQTFVDLFLTNLTPKRLEFLDNFFTFIEHLRWSHDDTFSEVSWFIPQRDPASLLAFLWEYSASDPLFNVLPAKEEFAALIDFIEPGATIDNIWDLTLDRVNSRGDSPQREENFQRFANSPGAEQFAIEQVKFNLGREAWSQATFEQKRDWVEHQKRWIFDHILREWIFKAYRQTEKILPLITMVEQDSRYAPFGRLWRKVLMEGRDAFEQSELFQIYLRQYWKPMKALHRPDMNLPEEEFAVEIERYTREYHAVKDRWESQLDVWEQEEIERKIESGEYSDSTDLILQPLSQKIFDLWKDYGPVTLEIFGQTGAVELKVDSGDESESIRLHESYVREFMSMLTEDVHSDLRKGQIKTIVFDRLKSPADVTLELHNKFITDQAMGADGVVGRTISIVNMKDLEESARFIPPVSDLERVLVRENVPIVKVDTGDFAFNYLLKKERVSQYVSRIADGETVTLEEIRQWQLATAILLIFDRESYTRHYGMSVDVLLKLFGLERWPSDELLTSVVVIDQSQEKLFNYALFEETFHVLAGISDLRLRMKTGEGAPSLLEKYGSIELVRNLEEIMTDLLQIMFFPVENWFSDTSPYSQWNTEERTALKERYLGKKSPNHGPNLRKILEEVLDDVIHDRFMPVGSSSMPVFDLIFLKSLPEQLLTNTMLDRIHGRTPYDVKDFVRAYLELMLETERFSRYEVLFPSWNQDFNSTMTNEAGDAAMSANPLIQQRLEAVEPLVFNRSLEEGEEFEHEGAKPYPGYVFSDGLRVMVKSKPNHIRHSAGKDRIHGLKTLLLARAHYMIALALGFEGVNWVRFYTQEKGEVNRVEEFFGIPLGLDIEEGVWNFRSELSVSGSNDHKRYQGLIDEYGETFVQGDIFRLLVGFFGDSHISYNIHQSAPEQPKEIRWVDYSHSFRSPSSGYSSKILQYLKDHKEFFMRYASDLVQEVVSLSDDDINLIAGNVFNEEVIELMTIKLLDNESGLDQREARTIVESEVKRVRAQVVDELKKRQAVFIEFDRWQKVEAGDQAISAKDVGGIDLNPKDLELDVQGGQKGAPARIPLDVEGLDPASITGFTPIILRIVPIGATNIPFLLGQAQEKELLQAI